MAVKQTKKQDWLSETMHSLFIGLFFAVLFLFGYLIYSNSTNYICSHNPEKCVCEGYDFKYCNSFPINNNSQCKTFEGEIINPCIKHRLKTPSQLLIDDCNNNPREDDKCKCESYDYNTTPNTINSFTLGTSETNINVALPPNCYTKDKIEVHCYNSQDKPNVTCDVTYGKLECRLPACIKSRPKTECEKGNPDWVEEINDFKLINNSIWWYCDFSPKFNIKHNSTKEEIDNDIERCSYYKNQLLNQTICREKGR